MNGINRREFLKLSAAAAAPLIIPGCSTMEPERLNFQKRKNGLKIENVTVISMKKGQKPFIADVLITGNKIQRISPAGVEILPAEKTISGAGKFLIPALIDSHCHITQMRIMSGPVMDPLYMVTGVTTVRDMSTAENDWDNNDFRPGFDEPDFKGPRVFKTAGFFDGSPGVFSWAIIPKSKKEAERHIDEIADNKISAVKIYSYMTPDMLKIIKAAADKKGLYIAGHVPLCMSAIEAAEMGINEFEHNFGIADNTILGEKDESFFLNMRKFGRNWQKIREREKEMRKLAAELKQRNVATVPTLVVMSGLGNTNLPDSKKDPRMRYLPEFVTETIWGRDNPMLRRWTDEDFEACRNSVPLSGRFTSMLREEGAVILAGTDSPASNAIPGFSLHGELKHLVQYAGFTPEEALASATRAPAQIIGVGEKLGTIEEGKIADLILLDENPLKDINSTEKISAIIFNGKIAEKDEIEAKLEAMEEKFHSFPYPMMSWFVKVGTNTGFSFIIPDPPGGWENQ